MAASDFVVAGVDEAGRGPLAGDVVASAVILRSKVPQGLTDSKRLSEKRRLEYFEQLQDSDCLWALGRASPEEIDELNILNATFLAMTRAVEGLQLCPDLVLVDGNRLPKWPFKSKAVVGGDMSEPAISAASILAKVSRDDDMRKAESMYPGYGFASHKGYSTAKHLEALRSRGVTPLHRRSFGPVLKLSASAQSSFT